MIPPTKYKNLLIVGKPNTGKSSLVYKMMDIFDENGLGGGLDQMISLGIIHTITLSLFLMTL